MTAPYPCALVHPTGSVQPQPTYPALDLSKYRGSYAELGAASQPIYDRVAYTRGKGEIQGFSRDT